MNSNVQTEDTKCALYNQFDNILIIFFIFIFISFYFTSCKRKIIKSMIVYILLITFYRTMIKFSMINKSIIGENKNIVKGTNTWNHDILDPWN